jgi:hypothetical protein
MINRLAVIFSFMFFAAGVAGAAQFLEREISCPVCETPFYARLDLDGSQGEIRIDLKPVGAGPWLLPDCPKCGFVSYKLPVPAAELARCRAVTASDNFRKSLGRSTYFRVGLLYEQLGKPDYSVATSFLKASWQEEYDPAKLKEDLELSLKYFTACAQSCGMEEKENSQLLAGELLRRLGRFGEAQAHLAKLQGLKGFQKNFFADIVDFELARCAKMDAAPYEMEDVRDFKRSLSEKIQVRLQRLLKYLSDLGEKTAASGPAGRNAAAPESDAR